MKILHLFSNSKWTGPAQLAVHLAGVLNREGVETVFACCRPRPGQPSVIPDHARSNGITQVHELRLDKHFRPIDAWHGMREVQGIIEDNGIDIVHVHLPNDHLIGGVAAKRSDKRPIVVRSYYDEDVSTAGLRERFLLKRMTDHLILPFDQCAESSFIKHVFGPDRFSVIGPGVDLDRFDPDRKLTKLLSVHVPTDSIIAGIIARVQTHRQYGLLLESFARAISEEPRLKLMIVGRGTNIEHVAVHPAEKLGIRDHVIFTGYIRDDEYVAAIKKFAFQLFLVPGSDRTCRAAREGMSLGKPLLVFPRGMLPFLVDNGKCGLVVNETVDELTDAILSLAHDVKLRNKLGKQAQLAVTEKFNLDTQGNVTRDLYNHLMLKRR